MSLELEPGDTVVVPRKLDRLAWLKTTKDITQIVFQIAVAAGVVLAIFIPMRHPEREDYSPLRELEHDLHGAVAFAILPIFAFANAGISLTGIGIDYLLHPVPIGIAAGLFIGKQIGVMGFCWLGVRM